VSGIEKSIYYFVGGLILKNLMRITERKISSVKHYENNPHLNDNNDGAVKNCLQTKAIGRLEQK
jgi:hypothetical protein